MLSHAFTLAAGVAVGVGWSEYQRRAALRRRLMVEADAQMRGDLCRLVTWIERHRDDSADGLVVT